MVLLKRQILLNAVDHPATPRMDAEVIDTFLREKERVQKPTLIFISIFERGEGYGGFIRGINQP